MKELTRAEEQIMQILWKIGDGFVKDILDEMEEPKPAYNTVSTIVRILEQKGMVAHRSEGRSHCYYPLLGREEYLAHTTGGLVRNYFNGSLSSLVSFFMDQKKVSGKELDEMLRILEEQKKKES